MSEEEKAPENNETYDLMLQLERLESLREDMEDAGVNTVAEVEAQLGKKSTDTEPLLAGIREELTEFGLSSLEEVEAEIDGLNEQLDEAD